MFGRSVDFYIILKFIVILLLDIVVGMLFYLSSIPSSLMWLVIFFTIFFIVISIFAFKSVLEIFIRKVNKKILYDNKKGTIIRPEKIQIKKKKLTDDDNSRGNIFLLYVM